MGCFSFYPAKNLGAWGDGGAVVTSRADLADRVRLLRSHGERPRYRHRVVGTTSRLDGLQAAILRVKLRHLDSWNAQRRRAAAELRRALQGLPLELPATPVPSGDHVYHLFVVQSDDRDLLRAQLTTRGIASAVHYPVPVHRTDAYAHLGLHAGSLPVAESMASRVCSLPIFPGLEDRQIQAIGAAAREVSWADDEPRSLVA
jgi:dTDP-4-amino-4,6-dideoxygalactose transaminase